MTNISESPGSYRLFSSSANSENKQEVSSEKKKDLPAEITHKILSYLPPQSLGNVAKTGKVGNQFVENALIWKKLGFINKGNGEDAIRNDRGEATHKAVADHFLNKQYNLFEQCWLYDLQQAVKSGKIAKKVSIPKIETQFKNAQPDLKELVPAGLLTQEEFNKLNVKHLSKEKTVHFTKQSTWMRLARIDGRPDIAAFLSVPDECITKSHAGPSSIADFLANKPQDERKTIQNNMLKSNLFPDSPNSTGNTLLQEQLSINQLWAEHQLTQKGNKAYDNFWDSYS